MTMLFQLPLSEESIFTYAALEAWRLATNGLMFLPVSSEGKPFPTLTTFFFVTSVWALQCPTKCGRRSNPRPHRSQTNFISPLWSFRWSDSWVLVLNVWPHLNTHVISLCGDPEIMHLKKYLRAHLALVCGLLMTSSMPIQGILGWQAQTTSCALPLACLVFTEETKTEKSLISWPKWPLWRKIQLF